MKILSIIGSATKNSSNSKIVREIIKLNPDVEFEVFDKLYTLPHFRTELTDHHTPQEVQNIRNKIDECDGVLFSTPEYIFSIPSALKNLLEWCVSTMVFDQKPVSIITASANGEKGHEELELILSTLGAKASNNNLLIKGIKGRFDVDGNLSQEVLYKIQDAFTNLTKQIVNEK